jgi:hypothetical protein
MGKREEMGEDGTGRTVGLGLLFILKRTRTRAIHPGSHTHTYVLGAMTRGVVVWGRGADESRRGRGREEDENKGREPNEKALSRRGDRPLHSARHCGELRTDSP